jgi:uncharacterized protein with GYD domain
MATFVVLANFTDQGIRNVKEPVGRAEVFKEMARKSGVTVKDLYWTLGQHDVVGVCEAASHEAATALALSVSSRGNVRSQTLRAFSFEEDDPERWWQDEGTKTCLHTNTVAKNVAKNSSLRRRYRSTKPEDPSAQNAEVRRSLSCLGTSTW